MRLAGGDARRGPHRPRGRGRRCAAEGRPTSTSTTAETAVDQAAVRYDREGDQHYDVISAFIKSIRGSDVDAALHYLARMIEAGEDPRFIARRLVISPARTSGWPTRPRCTTAVAAAQAVQLIGMPEAQLNLAQAVIALAVAPKSNAVITGDRRGPRRRPGRARRAGPAAPARRPLRGREEARPRQRLQLQPTTTARRRRSSTPRMTSGARRTTGPPSTAPRRPSRSGWERIRRLPQRPIASRVLALHENEAALHRPFRKVPA